MQQLRAIFGIHAVTALLSQQPEAIQTIYLIPGISSKTRLLALAEKAKKNHIQIRYESLAVLDKQVNGQAHQGVVAMVAASFTPKIQKDFSEEGLFHLLQTMTQIPFLLILDTVQDPHNLGACLRSANAAGVHAVIAPKDKAVGLTPVAMKVACGAAEFTPFFQVTNLARTLVMLKQQGIWLFGAAGEVETTLYQQDFTCPLALIVGNEEKGLRRLTRDVCDHLFKIPMYGDVESLNVSVATGICLFEVLRQRHAIH